MNFNRPRRSLTAAIPRLPLTAFIDVVLFLLLYFLLAGNLADAEKDLSSALQSDRRGSGAGADFTPQVVHVDFLNGQPMYTLGTRAMYDRESLTSVLVQLPKESGVFVKVNGRAPVGVTAAALQACKDAGFNKVSYVPAQ